MNSREKGKRGERQWRDELRAQGFQARRGQQFSGSPDSPDVVCEQLDWIHFEVKAVERLNIEEAMEQARRDCGRPDVRGQTSEIRVPIVAHRRSFRPWLVTMEAETFFRLLRGEFAEKAERLKSETLKLENENKNFKDPGGSEKEQEMRRAEDGTPYLQQTTDEAR